MKKFITRRKEGGKGESEDALKKRSSLGQVERKRGSKDKERDKDAGTGCEDETKKKGFFGKLRSGRGSKKMKERDGKNVQQIVEEEGEVTSVMKLAVRKVVETPFACAREPRRNGIEALVARCFAYAFTEQDLRALFDRMKDEENGVRTYATTEGTGEGGRQLYFVASEAVTWLVDNVKELSSVPTVPAEGALPRALQRLSAGADADRASQVNDHSSSSSEVWFVDQPLWMPSVGMHPALRRVRSQHELGRAPLHLNALLKQTIVAEGGTPPKFKSRPHRLARSYKGMQPHRRRMMKRPISPRASCIGHPPGLTYAQKRMRAENLGRRLAQDSRIQRVGHDEGFRDNDLSFSMLIETESRDEDDELVLSTELRECLAAFLSHRDQCYLNAIYSSAGKFRKQVVTSFTEYLFDSGDPVDFIRRGICNHVAETQNSSTLFRTTSLTTEVFSRFARHHGARYINTVARAAFRYITDANGDAEIDERHMDESLDDAGREAAFEVNSNRLCSQVRNLFDAVEDTMDEVPIEVRDLCNILYNEVSAKFPASGLQSVGGLFFLRFLCPLMVVVDPRYPLSREQHRRMILGSSVLQALSNHQQPKNPMFRIVNEKFIGPNIERMKELQARIASIPLEGGAERAAYIATLNTVIGVRPFLERAGIVYVNETDRNGWVSLHTAVNSGDLELVASLLSHPRVNVNLPNTDGNTAFHYIARMWVPEKSDLCNSILNAFLQRGVDLDKRNAQGETTLLRAIVRRSIPVVKWLLQNGASPNLFNTERQSPLHYAVKLNNVEVVQLLLDHGAMPEPEENFVEVACQKAKPEIRELISKAIAEYEPPQMHVPKPQQPVELPPPASDEIVIPPLPPLEDASAGRELKDETEFGVEEIHSAEELVEMLNLSEPEKKTAASMVKSKKGSKFLDFIAKLMVDHEKNILSEVSFLTQRGKYTYPILACCKAMISLLEAAKQE